MDISEMDQPERDMIEEYSIDRDFLARIVAAHTSGMADAIPEQEDFDNADAMIALLEERLSE